MNRPRLGDTVLSTEMQPFEVTTVGVGIVKGRNGSRRRTFKIADLECIDYDEGLWQEYPQ